VTGFARRWRELARAAAEAGEAPLPAPPDGARLLREAQAERTATHREPRAHDVRVSWPRPVLAGLLVLLWAVTLPLAGPVWRRSSHWIAGHATAADAAWRSVRLPRPVAPELALPRLPAVEPLRLPTPWESWPRLPWPGGGSNEADEAKESAS
jgi:hypothetical protein